jgi:predicted acylesterase/phospholipase RssA
MIKNLVISGGSMKTISVLGALKYLEENHLISNIDTYVGTSAGSIVNFFLILGYKIDEIIHFVKDHLFGSGLYNLTLDEVFNFNILSSFGMDSGSNIIKLLEDALFLKLFLKDVTFLEMTKITGKNLVICVANVSLQKSEYLSVDTNPDLSVITALRMSISLPLIFTPVIYKNHYYVDGGIYEAFPLGYIKKFQDDLKDTLGIVINSSYSQNYCENMNNMFDFISVMLGSIISKANEIKTDEISNKIKIIELEFENTQPASFDFEKMSFTLDEKIIEEYISTGYSVCESNFL